MADLTSKQRRKLPKSEFGLPGRRAYPVNDKAHAANAKARATQQVERGDLSPAEAAKIKAKANRVLGHGAGKTSHHGERDMAMKKAEPKGEHRGWYGAKPKGKTMHPAKEGEVKHYVKEPRAKAKEHERMGEKKHMAHEKKAREHESAGMKKAMEHKTIHIHGGTHHHHHHGK